MIKSGPAFNQLDLPMQTSSDPQNVLANHAAKENCLHAFSLCLMTRNVPRVQIDRF